jgi:hypothetical protein
MKGRAPSRTPWSLQRNPADQDGTTPVAERRPAGKKTELCGVLLENPRGRSEVGRQ